VWLMGARRRHQDAESKHPVMSASRTHWRPFFRCIAVCRVTTGPSLGPRLSRAFYSLSAACMERPWGRPDRIVSLGLDWWRRAPWCSLAPYDLLSVRPSLGPAPAPAALGAPVQPRVDTSSWRPSSRCVSISPGHLRQMPKPASSPWSRLSRRVRARCVGRSARGS
jgi:hypothetical protein